MWQFCSMYKVDIGHFPVVTLTLGFSVSTQRLKKSTVTAVNTNAVNTVKLNSCSHFTLMNSHNNHEMKSDVAFPPWFTAPLNVTCKAISTLLTWRSDVSQLPPALKPEPVWMLGKHRCDERVVSRSPQSAVAIRGRVFTSPGQTFDRPAGSRSAPPRKPATWPRESHPFSQHRWPWGVACDGAGAHQHQSV